MLGSALNDRCQTPVLMVEEVYNKSLIDWVSGQYGETLHSCAVFSLAFGSGKYFCTLVQYLAILTANSVNKIYIYIYIYISIIICARTTSCICAASDSARRRTQALISYGRHDSVHARTYVHNVRSGEPDRPRLPAVYSNERAVYRCAANQPIACYHP